MRIAPAFNFISRFRVAHLVVLNGVIALTACQDVTAPEPVTSAAPSSLRLDRAAATDELKQLGSDMDTMTGWSLISLTDGQIRSNIVGILNGLKGHLASGRIDACQDDVTQGRAWFASLTESQQSEQGNIGVTLDLIQSVLDNASQ